MRIEICAIYHNEKIHDCWTLNAFYRKTLSECKKAAQNAISKHILPKRIYTEIIVRIYDAREPKGNRLIDKWTYRPTYR